MKIKRLRKQSGFTLIEVMVVIVILGILAALVVPNVMGKVDSSKIKTTEITLSSVSKELDTFKRDNNRYPNTQDGGLEALVTQPANVKNYPIGGYLKKYPKDSWDNDLQYVSPGTDGRPYDLYSFGADGKSGGEGADADLYYKP